MERLISSQNSSRLSSHKNQDSRWSVLNRSSQWGVWGGWAAAACLLVLAGIFGVTTLNQRASQTSTGNRAALATELSDQHVATLAANQPPQVLSSDRHTVKPWFQGKLPFTFNLPENLPDDMKLEGANLTYLHSRPAAQLLYSIGRHRVSVFVQQQTAAEEQPVQIAQHAGFHLASFNTKDLNAVGISDVDPARLTDLMSRIEQVQAK
jgi:anti-sigma factor RsiW